MREVGGGRASTYLEISLELIESFLELRIVVGHGGGRQRHGDAGVEVLLSE